jgi:hypothetical protein
MGWKWSYGGGTVQARRRQGARGVSVDEVSCPERRPDQASCFRMVSTRMGTRSGESTELSPIVKLRMATADRMATRLMARLRRILAGCFTCSQIRPSVRGDCTYGIVIKHE